MDRLDATTSSQSSAHVKCGWVEKFSVGRGFFPVRNWKKRWLMVSHQGLNYSKDQGTPAANRTYIPFITQHTSSLGENAKSGAAGGKKPGMSSKESNSSSPNLASILVAASSAATTNKDGSQTMMHPVFLFPSVTANIHPEATDASYFYFGLRFEEVETPRILLLRSTSREEREGWVRFIGQFVHAASINGVPNQHPAMLAKTPSKVRDPEELDPKSQNDLRKNVMAWDDGFQYRAFGAEAPCESMYEPPMNWDSEGEETNGPSSPRDESQVSSQRTGAAAPGGGASGAGNNANSFGARRSSHAASSQGMPLNDSGVTPPPLTTGGGGGSTVVVTRQTWQPEDEEDCL